MATNKQLKGLRTKSENSIDMEEEEYLYITISQIPQSGNGLFTSIPIYKEEIIAIFSGEILSTEETKIRNAKNETEYFIKMIDGSILDSKNTNCFAKYANDANGFSANKFKNNAFIALNEREQVCIIASKYIAAGSEILCAYGKKYWNNFKKINGRIYSDKIE